MEVHCTVSKSSLCDLWLMFSPWSWDLDALGAPLPSRWLLNILVYTQLDCGSIAGRCWIFSATLSLLALSLYSEWRTGFVLMRSPTQLSQERVLNHRLPGHPQFLCSLALCPQLNALSQLNRVWLEWEEVSGLWRVRWTLGDLQSWPHEVSVYSMPGPSLLG